VNKIVLRYVASKKLKNLSYIDFFYKHLFLKHKYIESNLLLKSKNSNKNQVNKKLRKNNKKNKNITKKKNLKSYSFTDKIKYLISVKITFKTFIWIVSLFFIFVILMFIFFLSVTGDVNIKIIFISIFIGIAILKEITDEYIPKNQKKQVNIIVSGFILVFILIVVNEIIGVIAQ